MLKHLPAAFLYPFAGSNGFVFLAAWFLYALFFLISGIPSMFVLSAYCLGFFCLALHLRNVVLATIKGDDEPAWPGVTDIHLMRSSAAHVSFLLLLGIPALVWLLFELDKPIAAWLMALVAFLYIPIGLLASSVLDENDALNPKIVGRAILAAPLDYILLLLTIAGPLGLATFAAIQTENSKSLLFGALLAIPSALYALLLLGRIVGLYYLTHREIIAWDTEH